MEPLLRLAALAPVWLKTEFYRRVCTRLFGEFNPSSSWSTNLGIKSSYRIQLESSVWPLYLFGTPKSYVAERGALYLANALCSHSRAFIDIGAHMGYYTYYVRAHQTLPIYFFEPNPVLFQNIQTNIKANNLSQITGSSLAIGGESGETTFYLDQTDSSCSSLNKTYENHDLKEIKVKVITFSEFVKSNGLSNLCVKVDLENAEFDFLKGATLAAPQISHLIIEVLRNAVEQGFIQKAASDLQMHAYYICDETLIYCPNGKFDYVPGQYNWLFSKDSPETLKKKLKNTRFTLENNATSH